MKLVVHNAPRCGVPRDFADRATGGATSILELTETDRAAGGSMKRNPTNAEPRARSAGRLARFRVVPTLEMAGCLEASLALMNATAVLRIAPFV
jgi:hypothetical protein